MRTGSERTAGHELYSQTETKENVDIRVGDDGSQVTFTQTN